MRPARSALPRALWEDESGVTTPWVVVGGGGGGALEGPSFGKRTRWRGAGNVKVSYESIGGSVDQGWLWQAPQGVRLGSQDGLGPLDVSHPEQHPAAPRWRSLILDSVSREIRRAACEPRARVELRPAPDCHPNARSKSAPDPRVHHLERAVARPPPNPLPLPHASLPNHSLHVGRHTRLSLRTN